MSNLRFIFGLLGLLLLFPVEAAAQAKLTIVDHHGVVWQKATVVDFFEKQPVLAPGSEGTYQFTVKNASAETQTYQLKMSETTQIDTPLQFQVKTNGKALHGTIHKGKQLTEDFIYQGELASKKEQVFTIHWHWPFDEDHVRDTLLGKRASDEELTYQIGLALQTEDATLSATSKPQKDSNSSSSPYPLTGEALQYWWTYTGVLLIGCAILIKNIHHKRRVQR